MHAKEHCYSLLHRILGHRRVNPQQNFARTHFYTWVKRDKVEWSSWLKNQRDGRASSSVVRGVNRSATHSASFDFLLLFNKSIFLWYFYFYFFSSHEIEPNIMLPLPSYSEPSQNRSILFCAWKSGDLCMRQPLWVHSFQLSIRPLLCS